MKRMFVVLAAMSLLIVLVSQLGCLGCGDKGENPASPDYDEQITDLQEQIDDLTKAITKGQPPPVPEGAIPVETKDPVEQVQDRTGGLPPTGEPTGKPIADPLGGVPFVGEGRIVFMVNDSVYIIGSNGARIELVAEPEGGCRDPALSPDRQRIAYSGFDGDSILVIRHIASGANFSIKPPGGGWHVFPAWSPDGKRIAYSSRSNIFIADVDPVNPNIVQITHDNTSNKTPSWSPDGRRIVYSSNLDGNHNIVVIGIDGRDRIRLTNHPGPDSHPDWSPDGEHIAFMGHRDKDWYICVVNTRTFVETRITRGIEPSWSPDGKKIAFVNNDIWIINPDGTGLTNITNTPGIGEGSPDWQ